MKWSISNTLKGKLKIVDESGFSIANLSATVQKENEQNAKLIAASPTMLKALQGFIHHDDNVKEEYKSSPSLRQQIEDAIKQATE